MTVGARVEKRALAQGVLSPRRWSGNTATRGVGPVVSSTTTALDILLDEEETYAEEMV